MKNLLNINKESMKYFGFFLIGILVTLVITWSNKNENGRFVQYNIASPVTLAILDTRTGSLYVQITNKNDKIEFVKRNIIADYQESTKKK